MKISVIIPVHNEENHIVETVRAVKSADKHRIGEILVVDAASTDRTAAKAQSEGARVITAPHKGRAMQMNYAARQAEYKILYFLHADTRPPSGFAGNILQAADNGAKAGCFRLEFDNAHPLLNFYAWCTQFNLNAFRFGDQSLFVYQNAFWAIGGFCEDHLVMEDHEIIRRIKKDYSFALLDNAVTTSARSYEKVGIVKLQLIFVLIYVLYFLGVGQEHLLRIKELSLK